MTRFYYDDRSSEVAYSTSWVVYSNSTNRANPNQRLFYCILDDGQSSKPWKVFNGSTLGTVTGGTSWSVNKTRCSVSGLENRQYSLTLGQWQEDVNANGVTLDYIVVDNATEPSTTITWSSDFVAAEPLPQYAWTTATQSALPGTTTTSSAAPTSSPTEDQSSSGGSSETAIGVGVGVGVGGAVGLALIAGWIFWRRRNRSRAEGSIVTEPHHEIKAQGGDFAPPSGSGRSEQGGVLPFARSPTEEVYATSPSKYGGPSHIGSTVAEVQEHGSANGSYMSRGLDSPATFRQRGSAY
ncbi:hypothetical protein JCM11251_005844 [Rhodosporidiobolus azoricus]